MSGVSFPFGLAFFCGRGLRSGLLHRLVEGLPGVRAGLALRETLQCTNWRCCVSLQWGLQGILLSFLGAAEVDPSGGAAMFLLSLELR